jgi:hypothetical protein
MPSPRPGTLIACALAALALAGCGGDGDKPPAPGKPALAVQPTGVYRYATEGFERIGGPLPGRLRYPAVTTIAVRTSGCTLSERWEARRERYAEWRYCVTGDTWRLRSVLDFHEFFGNVERRAYRCGGRAVPRPDAIAAGFRWTDRCRAAETTAVASGTVVGIEDVRVRGTRVAAVHLRVHTRLGGDVRGAYTMDSWLRRNDGLLLRRSFVSDSLVDSIVGRVPAHEEYELRLRSPTPGE